MSDNEPLPYARPYQPPATTRPGTVTAGAVIIGIGAVLGIIISVVLLTALSAVPAGTAELGKALVLAGAVLAIGVVNLVAVIFIVRGFGIARIVVLIVGGIGLIIDLVSLSLTFGDALYVLAVVLLFLPKSSDWFRVMAAERK